MVTCGSMSEGASLEDFVGFREGVFYAEINIRNHCGDNITLIGSNGSLSLTAEAPWSGDTETGFGRDVTVGLDVQQATLLRDALNTWLASRGVAP